MQYTPARRALAGSVLVLGSVGTVSAVHLEAAQVPSTQDGRSAAAMAPPALPDTRTATPDSSSPTLDATAASKPSRGHRSTTRRKSGSTDRPVTSRDLIDMAHGPRGTASVVVPVHDLERTLPLRSALRSGRNHLLGAGLQSLDDILDFDGVRTSGRGWHDRASARALNRSNHNGAAYDRSDSDGGHYDDEDFDRADGYRSGAGYHRADFSWGSDDVSYSRPQCGRHRA
jgi:hypothetical protein